MSMDDETLEDILELTIHCMFFFAFFAISIQKEFL